MTERPTNPVKVIRAKCLECCCGQASEVALCVCTDCPLYEWRFGKNPYRVKRELTEAQLAVLERAREAKKRNQ